VLVVESDAVSANLLAIHLRDAGIEVRVAHDGKTGLEVAATHRPRAIVLDILLPRLDGWDFLAQLRANPETASIPVVIVSITEELGKGLALGAMDYLIDTYDPERLVKSVQRLCGSEIGSGPATVLAIDDDPRTLELISATLEPQGLRVLKARSGEEGLAMARRERPDLIVLDLMMPGLDGFEVSKALKDDPLTADVPIVVLTFRSLSIAEKQRLAGRIAHLGRKSEFQREEFVAFVKSAIERR
jgi:CheY-like chemotaxis protein